ncbi:MAG TPA: hypothetical protein VM755_05145 [Stellaceae bacterium]|nr:hypothetical protein [Stellaceae bacterium]
MLPLWVQALQALAVPVIAAVGAWVAVQQMVIARVKLQHDLYDRRYAVFDAVRTFLNEAVGSRVVSPETFRTFALGTADAEFLFDDAPAGYLREMREHASKAQAIYITIGRPFAVIAKAIIRPVGAGTLINCFRRAPRCDKPGTTLPCLIANYPRSSGSYELRTAYRRWLWNSPF